MHVFDTPFQLLLAEATLASFSRKFTPPKPYGKLYLNHMILTKLEQLVGGSTVRLFGMARLRQWNQWIALFFTVVRRMLLVLSLCSIRNISLFFQLLLSSAKSKIWLHVHQYQAFACFYNRFGVQTRPISLQKNIVIGRPK